jgi:hypothetical protein
MEQFICKYCSSIRKNENSLRNHERLCKHNSNRQELKSNFAEYNKRIQLGEISKTYTNQFTKAKILGLPKPIVSKETKEKLSEAGKRRIWTQKMKDAISKVMHDVVLRNPDSYSASNVCGRTKITEYKGFKLNGSWELEVAKWLDSLNLNWTNKIVTPFEYQWQGRLHLYFPDFYLPERNLYIEVKGYERDRDREKWKVVPNLLILKVKEIQQIQKGLYCL